MSVVVKDGGVGFVPLVPNRMRSQVLWKRNAFRFTSNRSASHNEVVNHGTTPIAWTVVAVVLFRNTQTVTPVVVGLVNAVCVTAADDELAEVVTFGIADKVLPHEILPEVIVAPFSDV